MVTIEKFTNGKKTVVSQSQNLRGIVRYTQKSPAKYVDYFQDPGGEGTLFVTYEDDAIVKTSFADYIVMVGWLKRNRSLKTAKFFPELP